MARISNRIRLIQRGAAALPIIISVAVVITLLQIPLLFKAKSGSRFTESERANITAMYLAEAGVEEIISDIGRKAIAVTESLNTRPHVKVGLGRGSYSTRVFTYRMNPEQVEVFSTGTIGGKTQSIRTKLELIRTPGTIPYDTPRTTLWGIRGTPATLYYFSLEERDSGQAWIHPEGTVVTKDGAIPDTENFAVGSDGVLYFIHNSPGTISELYRIRPHNLDNNPATPVTAELVGPTGLLAGTENEIAGIAFLPHDSACHGGSLYAVAGKSKKIFALNLENGGASSVAAIAPKGLSATAPFHCKAMTFGPDSALYVLRDNGKPELWRLDRLASNSRSKTNSATWVTDISKSGDMPLTLAGHPNGYLYVTDDVSWFKINPSAPVGKRVSTLFAESTGLRGMGFYFEREKAKLNGQPPVARETSQYCKDTLSTLASEGAETSIQLKIISWEETTEDLAGAY